jgi:hypothetical protein
MEEAERVAAAAEAAAADVADGEADCSTGTPGGSETSPDGKVGATGAKKKNQKKKKSAAQRKNTVKKSQTGASSDLTVKVFATMEKHKEVFFTIRLHSAQSAASLARIQVRVF